MSAQLDMFRPVQLDMSIDAPKKVTLTVAEIKGVAEILNRMTPDNLDAAELYSVVITYLQKRQPGAMHQAHQIAGLLIAARRASGRLAEGE